jgi:hypothetical protein
MQGKLICEYSFFRDEDKTKTCHVTDRTSDQQQTPSIREKETDLIFFLNF